MWNWKTFSDITKMHQRLHTLRQPHVSSLTSLLKGHKHFDIVITQQINVCRATEQAMVFCMFFFFFICWISVTFIFLHSETKPFFPQLLHAHSTCSEQDVLSAMNHRAVHHRDCSWHQCLGHMTTSTHQAVTSLSLLSCPRSALINLGKVQHHPAWAVGNWRSSWASSSITTFAFSN